MVHAKIGAARLAPRLRAQESPPASFSLVPLLPPIMDQSQTGSCVGHANATACYGACKAANKTLSWYVSPAGIYRITRCLERAAQGGEASGPLTDSGSSPADAVTVLEAWGVTNMVYPTADGRFDDCSPDTINVEPALPDLEAMDKTKPVVGHPIATSGDQLVLDVKTALASGCPVTVAVPGGSDAFQSYVGGILGPIDLSQNPIDHNVCLVGYDTETDGSVVFTIANSWGIGWGENGFVRVSSDFLQQSTADLYAIQSR
jgi:hypothetical protein